MTDENIPPSKSDNQALKPDQIVPPVSKPELLAISEQRGQPIQQVFYPAPYPQPTHQTIVVQQAPPLANSLGVVGFVFSILGFLSCGVAAFIGLPMSLIALFKAPRGLAIAGSIFSAAQIGFIIIFGLGPIAAGIAGLIGIGALWSKISGNLQQYNTTTTQFESAFAAIEKLRDSTGSRPSEDRVTSIIKGVHDGWGHQLVYEHDVLGDGYSLRSIGEDNKITTNDDRTMSLASYRSRLLTKSAEQSPVTDGGNSSEGVIHISEAHGEATPRLPPPGDQSKAYQPQHSGGSTAAKQVDSKKAPPTIVSKPESSDHADLSNSQLPISSYWSHNGSVMGLAVDGRRRKIVYVEVRDGMAGLVKPGSVLFSGISDGSKFKGKAFKFSKNLPPIEYDVEGPILKDGSTVVLVGHAPVQNSDGSVGRYIKDRLEFSFLRLTK